MDADDLARGRALLERSRDTTGSWQDWQIAGHHWQSWLATNAAALLDAAERAARLEVAAREALAVMAYDHAVTGDVDHATNEAARLLRAALEQPKGAGDA